MASPTRTIKKRLLFTLFMICLGILLLTSRLGYIQIVTGDKLRKEALEQWTRDIPVEAKRGIIYDRNGKKLAVSISTNTIWCRPADIEDPDKTAREVADILGLERDDVYKDITSNQSLIRIKMWVDKDTADTLRDKGLKGIEIVDDNRRYYPFGNFASQILGFTNIDNVGLYGIERTYNKYLSGTPGRWIKTVDAKNMEMPYNNERLYDPKNGMSVMLTIDETIQHFAEKAAIETLVRNKAKNVSILIMEPKTGDLLAMTTKPDYNPNDNKALLYNPEKPWEILSEEDITFWRNKPWVEKEQELYDSWRNFPINDVYEPGSTFKIITSAAGLEENVVKPDSPFHCDGYITQVKGARLKCWSYYNPHGDETFKEGAQNSCNEVFVELGLRLGKERMYKYAKAFGFGEKTGIELPGEALGFVRHYDNMREVNLATISYGQGISVTPIQMITAISAASNGGYLMRPNIVKRIIDEQGGTVEEIEPKVRRQVISNRTSKTLLDILESVVSEGTGKKAYVPGYRVGGKTGTAQKVIDGRYVQGKYVSSFAAIAPVNNPKMVVLVLIDEPGTGQYYGGQIAGPVAGQIIKDTLNYLEVEPQFTEKEEKELEGQIVVVPDVRGKTIVEASNTLKQLGLSYNTEILEVEKDNKVIDQFPLPGTKVHKSSMIDLYMNTRRQRDNMIIMPNLIGKNEEEVANILNRLSLRFKFKGEGTAISQNPKAGSTVNFNSLVEVEFEKTNSN